MSTAVQRIPVSAKIYIVEGDSALGACKLARDPEFQAIIPVRGKILNCLKSEYAKIFKNEIITDLIKVLGCGIEVNSKANRELSSFDLSLFRWSKVIICTDADVGRLPDPYADTHDALQAHANAHKRGTCVHS